MIDYLPKANHPPFLTGVGDGALRVTMNRLFSTLTQEQVDKHRHIMVVKSNTLTLPSSLTLPKAITGVWRCVRVP